MTVSDRVMLDARLAELAEATAREVEAYCAAAGVSTANEQKHLDPCCKATAKALAGTWEPAPVFSTNAFGDTLGWIGLGNVDIVVVWDETPQTFLELKCGFDKDALGPCAWDVVKLAAGLLNGNAGTGYMLAGAPAAQWEKPILGAELFETHEWRASDIRETYRSWFRFWEKDGHCPGRVAAAFRTVHIGSFGMEIAATRWELRLARVEPIGIEWLKWESLV